MINTQRIPGECHLGFFFLIISSFPCRFYFFVSTIFITFTLCLNSYSNAMRKYLVTSLLFILCQFSLFGKSRIYEMTQFGIKPDCHENMSPLMQKAIQAIQTETKPGDKVTLLFANGRYDFHEEGAFTREYYISNHDQTNPKKVGIAIEEMHHLTIEGRGAQFVFHGRMLPIAILRSNDCQIKDCSIDFENPHITQVEIIKNNPAEGITFKVAPWNHYRISHNGCFEAYGEGWSGQPHSGIAFEKGTKRLVYRTSDLTYSTQEVKEIAPRTLNAPQWKDERLTPGTVVAMRTYYRPTPGIFLSLNRNTNLKNVKVHYSEGMGLVAQMCENILLDGFSVCLKGADDPRYFTAQADATHFSGCKGEIISRNGLYEGMMDDAINIHGTYLKVIKRIDDQTLVARYMHDQAWGFEWGYAGDEVQFIRSETMEIADKQNRIEAISPHDTKEWTGVREFLIKFKHPIAPEINETTLFGIENLTWTPKVHFYENIIRNNRARGALFSTPRRTIVEKNLFDHTSGTAILLCGDCNGWYETGACREVIIRQNTFINALTNMFQFTNAIISIYPEIPNLQAQTQYFHGGSSKGIRIENNVFETFDQPILYAKSVEGITFKHNIIRQNNAYPAFHWNKHRFLLEKTKNVQIKNNTFENGFDAAKDIKESYHK